MVARVRTVAFQGTEALDVDVQVQIVGGLPGFPIVGLPDKAVAESRERVRAALHALGLALPPKRVTVNLAPADVLKEGSHFDLPIALALLVEMGVLTTEPLDGQLALGELALDGSITRATGALVAALHAAAQGFGLICPAANGPEAAWASAEMEITAAPDLMALINHLKGDRVLPAPERRLAPEDAALPDLREVKGQESAKRALEIAAAGGHNLLMVGPPGSGKSMLAARLPGILPPLEPAEALETTMIASLAGTLEEGRLMRRRPFRDPHHSASLVALIGGGARVRPGEVSLAHGGVLFLDELPEFAPPALEALRQPLESGRAVIARANQHVTFPARFQLVAAMNPCRCGHLDDPSQACAKAPRCGRDYQNRISGPLYDRIDLRIEVPAVRPADLALPPAAEGTAEVAQRVARARRVQGERAVALGAPAPMPNGVLDQERLERVAQPDGAGLALMTRAADSLKLSARAYHRVLRVARTLADLEGRDTVGRVHIAEALTYRRPATTPLRKVAS